MDFPEPLNSGDHALNLSKDRDPGRYSAFCTFCSRFQTPGLQIVQNRNSRPELSDPCPSGRSPQKQRHPPAGGQSGCTGSIRAAGRRRVSGDQNAAGHSPNGHQADECCHSGKNNLDHVVSPFLRARGSGARCMPQRCAAAETDMGMQPAPQKGCGLHIRSRMEQPF